MIKVRLWYHIY